MNGWLLVRIAGIVVGIATLLRVATNEGLVNYDPLFQQWLEIVNERIDWGFLTPFIGPFLKECIEFVRSFGISVPDLQDEWRPAWVLSILIFGAAARHSGGWWFYLAAITGALVVAFWSGLIGELTPIAIATLFFAQKLANFFVRLAVFFVAALVAGLIAGDDDYAAVAIATVIAFVTAIAVLNVNAGIAESAREGWRAVLANAKVNTGIDVLFTMAMAFVIAVAVANPPILW
jgi:hypothetical protein